MFPASCRLCASTPLTTSGDFFLLSNGSCLCAVHCNHYAQGEYQFCNLANDPVVQLLAKIPVSAAELSAMQVPLTSVEQTLGKIKEALQARVMELYILWCQYYRVEPQLPTEISAERTYSVCSFWTCRNCFYGYNLGYQQVCQSCTQSTAQTLQTEIAQTSTMPVCALCRSPSEPLVDGMCSQCIGKRYTESNPSTGTYLDPTFRELKFMTLPCGYFLPFGVPCTKCKLIHCPNCKRVHEDGREECQPVLTNMTVSADIERKNYK